MDLSYDWTRHHARTDKTPSIFTRYAITTRLLCPKVAIDFGCGNFRNTKFLLEQGFERVAGIDPQPYGEVPLGAELHRQRAQDYVPEICEFDFVLADAVLPFLDFADVCTVVENVRRGLLPGGTFAFNVLGTEARWKTPGDRPFYFTLRREEIDSLIDGFTMAFIKEYRQDNFVDRCIHKYEIILHRN